MDTLENVLKHDKTRARIEAPFAIGAIGPEGVALLIRLLDGTDESNKALVAQVIMGDMYVPKSAIPALSRLLNSTNATENARAVAGIALKFAKGLAVEASIPMRAQELINAPDTRTRRFSASELGKMGYISEPALPALRQALNDVEPEVRVEVRNALLKIEISIAAQKTSGRKY